MKFAKLNTAAQQREAIVQGRSLLPYRLRYTQRCLYYVRVVFFIFQATLFYGLIPKSE
ncbi:MAG: hypothetical protein LBK06_05440 [Planctomycetaceae bacterium]|nr:hypothetical protein [Planctomycetaceae bacterium]